VTSLLNDGVGQAIRERAGDAVRNAMSERYRGSEGGYGFGGGDPERLADLVRNRITEALRERIKMALEERVREGLRERFHEVLRSAFEDARGMSEGGLDPERFAEAVKTRLVETLQDRI